MLSIIRELVVKTTTNFLLCMCQAQFSDTNRNLAMQDFLVLWYLCQLPSATESNATNTM